MAKCENCGVEVSTKDLIEANGSKICEDCQLKMASSLSPSQSCG